MENFHFIYSGNANKIKLIQSEDEVEEKKSVRDRPAVRDERRNDKDSRTIRKESKWKQIFIKINNRV